MTVVWQRAPDVLWRRSGSRAMLSCPGQQDVIVIDGTAAVVWDLLATPLEQSELVSVLGADYAVDVARVQAEVTPFLRELWSAGAVQRT